MNEDDGTRELPRTPPAGSVDPATVDRWRAPRPDARPQRSSFIGMAGLAMVLFLILASGTVIPWWGLVALTLVWVGALVQGTRWFMTRPGLVLALPVGMVVLWLAVLFGGATLLDWGQ